MDWGTRLDGDNVGLIRFGELGASVLTDDDDVVIVIAPQNGVVAKLAL
jgi:hypothetical protein